MSLKRMRKQNVRVRRDTKRHLRKIFLNNSLEGGTSLSEMAEGVSGAKPSTRSSPKPATIKRTLKRRDMRLQEAQKKLLAEMVEFQSIIGADKQVKKPAKSGKPNLS